MASDVVTTHAILGYLAKAQRPCTLRELSSHFHVTWREALNLLWTASLVELDGYAIPFAIDLPVRPGTEEPGEPLTTADSEVWLDGGDIDVPPSAFTLSEIIVIVALLDAIAEVTPPSGEASLLNLRRKLAEAATEAGFGDVMWTEPEAVGSTQAADILGDALDRRLWVDVVYDSPSSGTRTIRCLPVSVTPGSFASYTMWTEEGLRHLKLARIAGVTVVAPAAVTDVRRARAAASVETPWRPEGETVTVIVTQEGRWIADWLVGARTAPSGDHVAVTFEVSSDQVLAGLLAQLGTSVVKLEPAAVASRMGAYFQQIASAL